MNYLCLVDGVVEYGSTSLSDFAHYQLIYAEEHQDADVQYLALTDEEYARSTAKKRAAARKGQQFSKQPKDVASKTARYRK